MQTHGPTQPESGFAIGFGLIAVAVFLFLVSLAHLEPGRLAPGPGAIALGLYLMLIGTTFLASYFYDHKSFLFRWCIWLCERLSFPAHRKMALAYATLAFGAGLWAFLLGFGVV